MKVHAASLAAILAFLGANAAFAADKLYTAYNIWFEQPTKVYSTNYQKGNLFPAGSEVTEVSKSSRKVEFTDPKLGMKFSVEFVAKHHPGVTGEQEFRGVERRLDPRRDQGHQGGADPGRHVQESRYPRCRLSSRGGHRIDQARYLEVLAASLRELLGAVQRRESDEERAVSPRSAVLRAHP